MNAAPDHANAPRLDADLVIVADWSAAQGRKPDPCEDRCWLAWGWSDERPGGRSEPVYCPTRLEAEQRINGLLDAARSGTVLIAIDVAIGYPPAETGEPVLPIGRDLVSLIGGMIEDDASGTNNRFEVAAELNRRIRGVTGAEQGPFWGRPRDVRLADVPEKRPGDTRVRKLRAAEVAARKATRTKPKSAWQLSGAGSVGSQTLMAMPMIDRLLARDGAALWPFEQPGRTTIAEVYPSMHAPRAPAYWYRDARQVCDTRDALIGDPPPTVVGHAHKQTEAQTEAPIEAQSEGWILGVPPTPTE